MSDRWFREHAAEFSGTLSYAEPLARNTYYRIGGPAAVMAQPKSRADLDWLAEGLRQTGLPSFVLGAGSNLLVSDNGYAGVVIRTNKLNVSIEPIAGVVDSQRLIRVGASVPVSMLLRRCAQEGWGGLEFLAGVPGWMGGVVTMDAGTHLGEAQSRVRAVEVFYPGVVGWETRTFVDEDLKFSYRRNHFLPTGALIWSVDWEITPTDPAAVKSIIDETLARRKASQPVDYPSCGSVFKNPRAHGQNAWQVIDALGLRGHRIGDAQFATKHSNFIINLDHARAVDVRALIDLAKTRALSELGILLEEEVMYLGF